MNAHIRLRRLSIGLLSIAVGWGVFAIVTTTGGWSRTGGILMILGGLLGIAANIFGSRHDQRRRQSGSPDEPGPTPAR